VGGFCGHDDEPSVFLRKCLEYRYCLRNCELCRKELHSVELVDNTIRLNKRGCLPVLTFSCSSMAHSQ